VHVSWNDAVAYCKWLSLKTGKKFRLPTEAEWEYACRAGTVTPFSTGSNLTTDQANYDGNYPYNGNKKGVYRGTTVPVTYFAPNAWGLYNMHGNVLEWCIDGNEKEYYQECLEKGVVQNLGNNDSLGANRVARGGSWFLNEVFCRSADRRSYAPGSCNMNIGFRIVRVNKATKHN